MDIEHEIAYDINNAGFRKFDEKPIFPASFYTHLRNREITYNWFSWMFTWICNWIDFSSVKCLYLRSIIYTFWYLHIYINIYILRGYMNIIIIIFRLPEAEAQSNFNHPILGLSWYFRVFGVSFSCLVLVHAGVRFSLFVSFPLSPAVASYRTWVLEVNGLILSYSIFLCVWHLSRLDEEEEDADARGVNRYAIDSLTGESPNDSISSAWWADLTRARAPLPLILQFQSFELLRSFRTRTENRFQKPTDTRG